jgi:hypothetical protein
MSTTRIWPFSLALAFLPPLALAAGDYVGVLRPTAAPTGLAIPAPGFYWGEAGLPGIGLAPSPGTDGLNLKLGYRYSQYLAVESGYADTGSDASYLPFSASASRSRGFSMDTIGTLPFGSRAAFYGRLGAWRSGGGSSLLSDPDSSSRAGGGISYGLGFKIDFTRQLGLKAEMERISPIDRWGNRDPDTDHVSVGVTWRF